MPPPTTTSIYPSDSITETAQSLPLDPLGPGAADLLAGDVEYRIHLIVQEAKKFMVNGKRGTLLPEDVEHAMNALNVEPILIPPRPLPIPQFQSISIPSSSSHQSQLYHLPDDEIDFATYLKQPLPAGVANSAGVKWKAHWLAVEGVQPAIKENPTPTQRAGPSRPQPSLTTLRPQARAQLPQELQLYFTRLTTALVPTSPTGPETEPERHRLAALTSLRTDVAVSGILLYVVKWLGESIQKCLMAPTGTIGQLIDATEALIANDGVFLEPYIHILLPPLMSIILTVPLGPHPASSSSLSNQPSPYDLRLHASQVLGKIAEKYGKSYPGLIPRLVSTLSKALRSPPFPSPLGAANPPSGRYEGCLLALSCLGAQAVRSVVWGKAGEGVRVIDDLAGSLYTDSGKKKNPLIRALIKCLSLIISGKPPELPTPQINLDEIADAFGPNLANMLNKKLWTASEILRIRKEELQSGSGQVGGGSVGGGESMEVDQ
ncbi:uncharacterized protein I303_108191 [Kwoniella dejecticola CBS 10117]|uniref:Transcription initiation factor TFIID subunit 6 n=1 Tax=Kwoniella dejecticola CBS 10117 TaxID=1296121 RepID=A0A1A5ZY33_9TREE|nr:transcription initiation factor TFIID subunit 6 [Kwoniella dejecticola CBS 10117]OBR82716.1 transcription initiation factor TFIID subunit 6 [Kwoniella dejecticola CBS 10117]